MGFELARSLASAGSLVVLDRAVCDLGNVNDVRRILREYQPDVVVNAAAYTAVDAAEHDSAQAFLVNATAVGVLAEETRALGGLFVHYSTDHVFDSALARPYVESDPVHPRSVYGKSKAAGEALVCAAGGAWLVLRTSWVAGAHGGNFVKAMLRQASTQSSMHVVADQHGAPTTAAQVADATARIVTQHWLRGDRQAFPSGIYHLAAAGETTWHAYAVRVLEFARARGMALRVAPEEVRAISSEEFGGAAPRPANARLDTTRLRETFGIALPEWTVGIEALVAELVSQSPSVRQEKVHVG